MLEGTSKDKHRNTADPVKKELQDIPVGDDSEHGALRSDVAAATRD